MAPIISLPAKMKHLCDQYKLGKFSHEELVDKISYCVLQGDFFSHIHLLAADIIEQLRILAENAPGHPEDIFNLRDEMASYDMGINIEQAKRASRRRLYWIYRRLSEYFYPHCSLPRFEPILHAGYVKKSIYDPKGTVLFLDKNDRQYLLYDHPVILTFPNKRRIVTQIIDKSCKTREEIIRVKAECTANGLIIIIAHDVCDSVHQVPAKTEISIDRTAYSRIPEIQTIR